MDRFKIDSHKLIYHIPRISQWLKGADIYPIYAEIAPSGACNHRCIFCALDYLGYRKQFIQTDVLKSALRQMAECGVKSVMFAGEGEPLLHKDIVEIVSYAKKTGLDAALTTNGVLLNKSIADKLLKNLSWLRVSLNAGCAKTYARIHNCNPKDFKQVMANLSQAVKIKKTNGYTCTIGAQCLLLPDNCQEIIALAKNLKKIGVDYFIVKPYSQHPRSKNKLNGSVDYSKCLSLEKKLDKLSDNHFQVVFRRQAMKKLGEKAPYKKCFGFPFWAYIDSKGDIYACSTFLGDKHFCYGNIYKNSFKQIWQSKKKKEINNIFNNGFTIEKCRKSCRLDEINRYLWQIKNPPAHVNFI